MTDAAEVKNDISQNISRISSGGAGYVDARYYMEDSSETLVLYDGDLEANDTTVQSGVGVRVLWDGAWGFAATSDPSGLRSCFDKAAQNARTASELVKAPLFMGKRDPVRGSYSTPVEVDPFTVSLQDKLTFMTRLDNELKDEFILKRIVYANFMKKSIHFQNSEGSEIQKDLSHVFGMMMAMALDCDGEMQRRSMNLYSTGDGTAGWEMMTNPELFSGHAGRIKSELVELIKAPQLEHGRRSVILLPGQGHLQVHETIGHPLELDRILGYELSYAGGSFVDLDSFGKLQYGSEKLSVSSYGGIENSPGSFGFDDDGTLELDYLLIDRGLLVNALTSRAMVNEANEKAGREVFRQSGGAARATSFYKAPIDRMTNVNILPGTDGTLEDIIASTEDGIVVDNPVSWSIGSNREHFHFGCEIAWEIKDGKRTRILRNPTYQGHTLEFYRSLSAVGDRSTWKVEQVNNCGKGEPNQVMQIGHGVPVVKFDDVITGERK
ncbi:MAG: TldD/PmbA family protein [Candidatus Fermentibacteraceae bacterium]|nr:TldD/PmbA family protein [Candidatus Fermentibacteraceae bacterium]MBN2608070.1 TldD/PmbA family protein [Candidatus Fermentibacteraceae bacterium]